MKEEEIQFYHDQRDNKEGSRKMFCEPFIDRKWQKTRDRLQDRERRQQMKLKSMSSVDTKAREDPSTSEMGNSPLKEPLPDSEEMVSSLSNENLGID